MEFLGYRLAAYHPTVWGASYSMPGVYDEACSILERLCPNPRPQPLLESGFSLASLSSMDPLVFGELAGLAAARAAELLAKLRELLTVRGRVRCVYCGSKASAVYERWVFEVDGSGKGRARLEGLVPVCKDCMRALEPVAFLSSSSGKEFKWLVKYLSKVNKVEKRLVEHSLRILAEKWRHTRFVSSWSIDASSLSRYGVEYLPVQHVLQLLAEGRIRITGGKLVVPNPSTSTLLTAVAEAVDALCSGRLNTATIAVKASSNGLLVSRLVLSEYMERLLESGLCGSQRSDVYGLLEGAWSLALPAEARARVLARLVSEPGISRTHILRVETPLEHVDPAPIHFYSAPSIEPEFVARSVRDVAALVSAASGQKVVELRFYPKDPVTGKLMGRHLYTFRLQ